MQVAVGWDQLQVRIVLVHMDQMETVDDCWVHWDQRVEIEMDLG
jgi:hypothetical protein